MTMFLQETPSFDKFYRYGCWCFVKGENLRSLPDRRFWKQVIKLTRRRVCAWRPRRARRRDWPCLSALSQMHFVCQSWPCRLSRLGAVHLQDEQVTCLGREEHRLQKQGSIIFELYLFNPLQRDSCRRHHCECDKKMAMDLVALESQHSPYFSHANGAFETEKFCAAKTQNDKSSAKAKNEQAKMEFSSGVSRNEESCCGEYPERFPFRIKDWKKYTAFDLKNAKIAFYWWSNRFFINPAKTLPRWKSSKMLR